MNRVVFAVACLLASTPAFAQDYRFPIERPGANATQPYITAYRDHDGGGGLEDWNCGNNTYNGHRGTDIGIGGFAVMDAGSRWVVAAADGDVTYANDGCFDRCTSGECDCGGGFGNYVKITHADGKNTYYGHMMDGSVQVSIGDHITCGQRLGKVASSGSSTGPHLHFEPRYSDNTSDDPFGGPCGGPLSYWVNQGAYNDLPEDICDGANNPPPPPPPPEQGTIKGVLWDRSVTATPNDGGNVRVPGATISVEGTMSVATARDGDAFWTFTMPAGNYRITVSAAGYEEGAREVVVTAGQDVWASIGLSPNTSPPSPKPTTPGEVDDPNPPEIEDVQPAQPAQPATPMVSLEQTSTEELQGGCSCVASRPSLLSLGLMLPLLALLLLAGAPPTTASAKPTFVWPTPEGWKSETIPFPLEFAPDLPYHGLEELRFAPGMFKPTDEYFSYTFVWWLDGPEKLDADSLIAALEKYFQGLAVAVEKKPGFKAEDAKAKVHLATVAGDPHHLKGTARIYDAFATHAHVTLNLRIDLSRCEPQKKHVALFLASPKPVEHATWKKLESVAATFRCAT